MAITQDAAMRMSTEQLRRELERLLADEEERHAGDIAAIRFELARREQHGGDHDIDFQ